jgi:hypothetical protein
VGSLYSLKPVFFIGLVLVSGCLGSGGRPGGCGTVACDDGKPQEALVPSWGVLDSMQFQDCQGGVLGIEAPLTAVQSAVPLAFKPSGRTPATVSLLLDALSCGRLAVGSSVFHDVQTLKIVAFVRPQNRSWDADGIHYFVLGVMVSDPDLARLMGLRMPTEVATFALSAQPLANGASIESWTVRGACTLGFELHRGGKPSGTLSDVFHFWTGTGPFTRIDARDNYAHEANGLGGVERFEGPCPNGPALGPVRAHTTQAYVAKDSAWTVSDQRFSADGGRT